MRTNEITILGDFLPRDGAPVADQITEVAWIGGAIVITHGELWCLQPCAIHAPSEHHMRDLPMRWRQDRQMIERVCAHGIEHPDPDQLKFWQQRYADMPGGAEWLASHNCCKEKCCNE